MPSELIQTGSTIFATPEAWEEAMRPIADVRVREVFGRQFSAELQMFELPRTTFSIRSFPASDLSFRAGVVLSVSPSSQTDKCTLPIQDAAHGKLERPT